jgi:hypothetical protein
LFQAISLSSSSSLIIPIFFFNFPTTFLTQKKSKERIECV